MTKNKIEQTHFSIGSFEDEPDDLAYWLSKSAEERLAAVEFLRRQFYSYGNAEREFRRLLEIAERQES